MRRATVAKVFLLTLALACGSPASGAGSGKDGGGGSDGGETGARRIAILLIGDGMGRGQLEAASIYAHGQPGQLYLQTLPHRGELATASLSGTTDSAAAATAMATGVPTFNSMVGLGPDGEPRETLVERARALGLPSGLVTTSALPHATPAAFSAHRASRHEVLQIAEDQALDVRAEVMLGGGARFYLPAGPGSDRGDGGLIEPLEADGYRVVRSAAELAAAPAGKVVGLFASEHLDYVLDRAPDSGQPTLAEMTLDALDRLDALGEDGFFLMVEGARIDMASHGNDLERTIYETLALDETARAVAEWASGRDDVTIVITADHECGGLEVIEGRGAGELPAVAWRWGKHTNARVDVFASGPLAEVFAGEIRDFSWVHAVLAARLDGEAELEPPAPLSLPDGRMADLRHRVAEQAVESGFGPGHNRIDAIHLDADEHGLGIGIEGLFEWGKNALVVAVDVDFGEGTGPASLAGALSDHDARIDSILSSLALEAPPAPGFGADLAIVSFGGDDPQLGELSADAGARGLRPPYGDPADLGWHPAALNFGDGVRVTGPPAAPVPGEGFEARIPWTVLYPGLGGGVPPNATVAVFAALVNDDGGFTSNQALPPFSAGTENPGRAETPVPGVVVFPVDSVGDGAPDGDGAPWVVAAPK